MSLLGAAKPPVVLIADDVPANRELLESILLDLGYDVRQARDGIEALEAIEAEEPDLVLLDIEMPRLDGLALCRRLKADPRRRLVPVVLITAFADRETRLAGLAAGADDFLTKPFDAKELLVRTRILLRERVLDLQLDAAETVILSLARIAEARDRYTIHHAERVGRYAREMAKLSGWADDEDLDGLYKAGVLHDLGKLVVPAEILLKPSPLSEAEWAIMRLHPARGAVIAEPLHSVRRYLPVIRHHHERWDGGGYPDRLERQAIPLSARIAAVADAWDAMTSDRPYRAGLSQERALQELRAGAGTQFDPAFVEAFVRLYETGEVARIAGAQFEDPAA